MTDFIANNFLWSMRSIAYILRYAIPPRSPLDNFYAMDRTRHMPNGLWNGWTGSMLPAHERDHLRFLLDWLELLRLRRFPRQMIGKLGIHTNRRFGFAVSIVLQCGDHHQQLVVYHRVAKP